MKRLVLTFLISLFGVLSMSALSRKEARREAWFLTDKMAYELNLTPEQCDVVYEINLDYFLSIKHPNDCRGIYWRFRAEDLRYVLFRWQYNMFVAIDYFYYPIRWLRSSWYYPVCHHYRRGYYYFDRPVVYVNYHGSSWRHRSHLGHSPYRDRHFRSSMGLRDRHYVKDTNGHYRPRNNSGVHTGRPTETREPNRKDRPSRELGTINGSGSHGNPTTRPERNESSKGSGNDRTHRQVGSERPSRDFNGNSQNSGTSRERSRNRTVSNGTQKEKGNVSRERSHSRTVSSSGQRENHEKTTNRSHERTARELGK